MVVVLAKENKTNVMAMSTDNDDNKAMVMP